MTMALGSAVVGHEYKSAVDLLHAPSEETSVLFLRKRSLGRPSDSFIMCESALIRSAVFFRDDSSKKSSDSSSNLLD